MGVKWVILFNNFI